MNRLKLLGTTTLALMTGISPVLAQVTEIGAPEVQVNIVAWPGYIERGETDKAFDWVTKFEQASGCKVNVKTANTWSPHGSDIVVPQDVPEVEVGASVGMVMGDAGRVAGYVLMNDLSIPHASFFRPPVKFKCLDGFLGVGPAVRAASTLPDAAGIRLEVRINGALRQSIDFSGLVRPAPQLVADVMAFMTLQPGDVLMLGCDLGRPLARAGDRIDISAPGFAALRNTLVAEVAS